MPTAEPHSRWAEIDLAALRHNISTLGRLAGGVERLMAVVKADAYGHGARPVVRTAAAAGVRAFAVSTAEEAADLRGVVEMANVLVLSAVTPRLAARLVRLGCQVACWNRETADALAAEAEAAGHLVDIHLKVDTGMGRLGCAPAEVPALAALIAGRPGLRLAGIFTHFAASEDDPRFTADQLARFHESIPTGYRGLRHAANSGALLGFPDSRLDLVRTGLLLYGVGPGLRPVMSLRARVIDVKRIAAGATVGYGRTWRAERESTIAIVAAGYADGVHRARSNRGAVLLRGRRAPVVGRVSMDSMAVDVSAIGGVRVDDVAVVFGRDGDAEIGAEEVAQWYGTVAYEVLTSVSRRVPRLHQGARPDPAPDPD